ncbi:MAG: solute carrier family 26 protein [Actinomycetes bacterium]
MSTARSDTPGRFDRLLPGLTRLRRYERAWLRFDLLAGITVAAYLVPQVMAYAGVAGLPAVAGLWAIVPALFVYAFVGSSRQLSVGPESTTALMTAVTIGGLAAGSSSEYAALAAALAIMVGLFSFVAYVARLGFLSELLSKPVLTGYMAGVALIMIVSQLGKVTGIPIDGDTLVQELRSLAANVDQFDPAVAALAATVLTVILVGAKLRPRWPWPLVAMLGATAAVWMFGLDDQGIPVVGPIPAGVPSPQLPAVTLSQLESLLLPAVGVLIVGYSDNILTARAFADRNGYSVDANQELLALGSANVASGLFQGFPVSSSGSRTVIGDSMGSKSQLYSLVALAGVVAVLVFLGPVLALFPYAALGAIVIYAALRLIDIGEFRRIKAFRTSELTLALATTLGVLVFDILYGVLIAVALSLLDLLRRVARPHDGILGYVPGLAGMHDIDDYETARMVPGLVVYRYDSPLFFANGDDFHRRAMAALEVADQPVEWFVLNAEANVEIDITAIDAMADMVDEMQQRGVVFAMARVKQDLRDDLQSAGFIDKVGADRIFPTLPTAVSAYLAWYTDKHGAPPRGVVVQPPPPDPFSG